MKFVCYANWSQLPECANILFTLGEKENLFYTRAWFENLTTVLDADQSLILATVEEGDQIVALLPLVMNSEHHYISFKHRYTTHFSLLLADENQQQIIDCLVQGMKQLPMHSLLLEPVACDDPRMLALQHSMQLHGYQTEAYFRFYNWIYRVQGQSFDDYMAQRPARLRNTIARKKRKLEREHGCELRLYTGDEVPQAMPDYYAPYTASWKANEQYVEFLNGLVAGFSRPGWSRLGVLYVADKPVAAQLWFVVHGKASIFRLAYDEAWKAYSPGSILTAFLMEYVIETDKVEEIDFLTGNEAYKQDWMSERRERTALSFIKNPHSGSWFERKMMPFLRSLKKAG